MGGQREGDIEIGKKKKSALQRDSRRREEWTTLGTCVGGGMKD